MAQRISRAKRLIQEAGGQFTMPGADDRDARLVAVRHVLYVMFSEGYLHSFGSGLHRVDLSDEAIRLTRELSRLVPDDAEVEGLLALMLLTDARRPARTGPDGELVPLDEQDRSLWDRTLVREGTELVTHALSRGAPGPFGLQAAIAALHDEAASVETTDWPQILALYDVLESVAQNPMVSLNRAIAFAMVHGPERGLELLQPLAADSRLREHHLLHAARGHLLERAGDHGAALSAFLGAIERTTSIPERNYLLLKAARLRQAHGLR
jgi:predicted RNA polymerase sigma factor